MPGNKLVHKSAQNGRALSTESCLQGVLYYNVVHAEKRAIKDLNQPLDPPMLLQLNGLCTETLLVTSSNLILFDG
ncbi:hypothetical protein BKA82DRAFT_329468 [Pisolithus tinctorius]|uniref:Uncharacterized protein n=1 Tax=Pisolithus tinctorius Marx 270 TaxID=870435 RepID=A0A0C3KH55_PISTI|nr:hypothetical protein BKA82DRAFT_329468 [Pisolithus tinctorius]KIO08917.1 hypothetical protein M404DRAFT_329468 [Pisolithus tinctorius Marx 270]